MVVTEFAELASTNDWMTDAAASGADEGDWVRADCQTAGRGRRGRAWISPPGNLYASVLVRLRPTDPPAQQLGFVAALALHETLAAWVEPRRMQLKWPNDLLLDGRKLSGILLERNGDAVIVGFGVNLAHYPTDVERPAISLAEALGVSPAPQSALAALAEAWTRALALWRDAGFDAVRQHWLDRAHPVNTDLVARLADGEELRGRFDGIDEAGALRLRLADGTMRLIHAADIFAL